MAISRPFLLALLGAVLVAAIFFAVQSSRTNSAGDAAPAAQPSAPEQAGQAAQPAARPEDTLKEAFDLGALGSAAFSAELTLAARSQALSVDVTGAYEKGAANDIPEFALDARIAAAGERLQGGFVSLGDKAYFTRGETGWQVPEPVWDPLVEAVATGAGAQRQRLPLAVNPETWVRDAESEGTETIDGVETTHVSATIDPERVVRDLGRAARQSGAALPDARDASRVVERAELDAWVGSDDRVLRRLSARIDFEVPAALRGPGDAARSRIDLDLRLTDVNRPQEIEAPADVRQGLPDGNFGLLAGSLTTGLSGATGAPPVSVAALDSPNPRRAARAVRAGKKVVVLFRNPRGLDDRAMTAVMRDVGRRTNAVVLTDHVDAVDRYGKLVEDLGVSQTPSVVLIDSAGQARLIEGYVDSGTLTQAVADAR